MKNLNDILHRPMRLRLMKLEDKLYMDHDTQKLNYIYQFSLSNPLYFIRLSQSLRFINIRNSTVYNGTIPY